MVKNVIKYSDKLSKVRYSLHLWMIIELSIACSINALPNFSSNESFMFFSWTRKESDSLNYGYNLFTRISSQVSRNDSIIISATVRVAGLPEWLKYAENDYGSLEITFTNSRPWNIIKYSSAYKNCPWLTEFHLILDDEEDIFKFPFPIPDQENPYHKYDYFTIAVNDSVHLQFQGVQDNVFMGSFLNNKRRNDPEKWLMAKGAIMVRTSNKSPFKINNIELNAKYRNLITAFLGSDLSRLSTDCDYYGMYFRDTSITENAVIVKNIQIPNTRILTVDSIYNISWTTEGKESIQACSIYINFNNDSRWMPIGKTAGNIEQYSWLVPNVDKTQCAIQVKAIGKDGLIVSDISESYVITKFSQFQLQAEALTNTSALLQWNSLFLDSSLYSLVIAYSTNRSVLSNKDPSAITVHFNYHSSSDTIYNLKTGTFYYFAAFKETEDGRYLSAGPFSIDSVKIIDNIPPVNSFRLTSFTDTSRIILKWESISPIPSDVESIGIFVCKFRYPASFDDTAASLLSTFPAADSNFLFENPVSNQTYYYALMVSDSMGNWAKPTDNSVTKARSGKGTLNVIEITDSDAQHLFSDSLIMWGSPGISFKDTIDYWDGPLNGFIKISPGYQLRNGKIPFWAQVHYSNSLYSVKAEQILLYSYDIYKGSWLVTKDSVIVDTIKHTVSARNSLPAYPFIFLIDTLPPVIKLLNNTNSPVTIEQKIIDTLSVSDNIKNYSLQLLASAGDEVPSDQSLYISSLDTLNNLQLLTATIPPGKANAITGLRSSFVASDGINNSSVNLSRPVIREDDNCDNFTSDPLLWTPVLVSAHPDHPDLKSVMKRSSGNDNWTYDPKEMRIIKWVPGHPDVFDDNWVEYGAAKDSFFTSKPGTFFWIRTKNQFRIDFGSAIIPQLIDTPSVTFKPEQWTDFSNPLPFDIYIGDIFQTITYKTSTTSADSLEIYNWNYSKGNYHTSPIYLSSMPGLHELNDTIKSMKPYAVYNPCQKPVSIYFPPVCVPFSTRLKDNIPLAKKRQSSNQWSLRIDSWGADNTILPPIYCGYISGLTKDITYHKSPSFSQQRISIYDSQNQIIWGNIISAQKSDSGNYYELLFENYASSPVTIRAAIGRRYHIDKTILVKWYDPEIDIWTNAQDTIQIPLKSRQNQIHILAVGNDQYFRDLRSVIRKNVLALRAAYPNPFNRYLTVQFTLPYKAQKVSFYIYNLIGQALWRKDIINPKPGPAALKMDMQLATGMYVLQMKVKVEGSESPKIINRAVMCTK